MQGELEQAHLCRHIGMLEIAGCSLKQALPAGSELEVTLELDRGGRLACWRGQGRPKMSSVASFFERLFGSTFLSDLEEGRRRGATLSTEAVPEETCERLRRQLDGSEWRFAIGQVLLRRTEVVESDVEAGGHSGYVQKTFVVYGWREDNADLRVHRLDRSLSKGEIEPASENEVVSLMETAHEGRFVVAYRRRSTRHGLFALQGTDRWAKIQERESARALARLVPRQPIHVSVRLKRGALTPLAKRGLVALKVLPLDKAWWLVADLMARVVLPDTLDWIPTLSSFDSVRLHALPLHGYAAQLRKLPPLPESTEQVCRLIRQASESTPHSRFLGSFEIALNDPGEMADPPFYGMGDEGPLEKTLQRWPAVDSSGYLASGGDSILPSRLILEEVARRVSGNSEGRADPILLFSLVLPSDAKPLCAVQLCMEESCVIGRGVECDVKVISNSMSRKHAVVYREAGIFLIKDLQSAGGTFLKSKKKRIDPRHAISSGEEFMMGDADIKIEIVPAAEFSLETATIFRSVGPIRRP